MTDWPEEFDLAVVRGGNAALCAAITAAEAGAKVMILEAAPKSYRGGNSRHNRNFRCMHQGPMSPLTDADHEDEYFDDLMLVTKGKTDETLARLSHVTSAFSAAARMKNLSGGQGQGCSFEKEDRFPIAAGSIIRR